MTNKIVVPNRVEKDVLDALGTVGDVVANPDVTPFTPDQLREACQDATGLMAFMTEAVDRAFLDAAPRLKVVAGALKGFDNIDVEACSERGVLVTVVPDLLTEPTAELTLGLMIALARNLRAGDHHVRSGQYQGWRSQLYGLSLQGATIGVIGAGAVGREILKLLSGFRGQRLYHDTNTLDASTEQRLNVRRASLGDLIETSDFIVLAVPLTKDTLGMVDQAFLARMKPGACMINPARGSLVQEAAVAEALASGRLSGYAADTYEMEDWARVDRPRTVHPSLLASEKTVLTPHLGSAVIDVRKEIAASAADSIITVLRGGIPTTALNAEALAGASPC